MADEMPEIYPLETIEQLRAISDELRLRIIEQLGRQPMTVTQLGDRLGIAPAKAHYHVRELERVGLVRLVETREKGGVLEKYYRTIAHDFRVPSELLRSTPPDEALAAMSSALSALTDGLLRTLESGLRSREGGEEPHIGMSSGLVYMTEDDMRQVMRQIEELLKPYEEPRGREGEVEHATAYFIYPTVPRRTRQD